MTTLLIAAVARESRYVTAAISSSRTERRAGYDLTFGRLGLSPVALLLTGVGAIRASAAASAVLSVEPFERILNFGVGGAYPNSGLNIGDLTIAVSECDPQSGILTPEGFRDLGGLGFPLAGTFPNKLDLRNEWLDVLAARLPDAEPVGVASVHCCSGTDALAAEMETRSDSEVEAMEGFALACVARKAGIPFAEIRAISNSTGDRDRQRWNLDLACDRIAAAVRQAFGEG